MRALVIFGALSSACGQPPAAHAPTPPPDAPITVVEQPPPDPQIVCSRGPTLKGIDVSTYQGAIDWSAVKADGVEFAFIRVSHGLATLDQRFQANWDAARANGIVRGIYQYFRPEDDPVAQADLLLAKLDLSVPGDLVPVIDVEANGGLAASELGAKVQAWVDHVAAAIGQPPIVYTNFYFWRDKARAADFTASPLWHAQYTTAECPRIAAPWKSWAFWQFTSTGTIGGITGHVDIDRFNGTRDELQELAIATH